MLQTRLWWKDLRNQFDLFTSDFTIDESSRGDPVAAAERIAAITDVPLVPISAAVHELAGLLLQVHALPLKARVDALHLATAATNGLEFLLTWNCRHLANASLRAKIEKTCREAGFEPPTICTPFELGEVP
jgi:hypothetical protein